MQIALVVGRVVFSAAFLLVLLAPAWWLAGRIQEGRARPFFRLLSAAGLALAGYVSGVNLLGRLTGNSIAAVIVYFALNVLACALLLRRRPEGPRLAAAALASTW